MYRQLPTLKQNLTLVFPHGLLRPLVPDDVHAGHVEGLNDPDVNEYLVAVRQQVQTLETVRAFVQANHIASDAVLFGIWLDGHTKHCGTVRLHQINREDGVGVLGICIFDKNAWGRAVGSTAIGAVTRWAFDSFGLDMITAGTYAENVGSWKAFIKAGYSVVEDIPSRYVIDDKPTVVRSLIARSRVSNAASRSKQFPE